MVQATIDPMVQPQEAWSLTSQNTYLVVYQYALGARLYLISNADADEILLLNKIHNHYTDEANVRVVGLIRLFAERYAVDLIYDTAEKGPPPQINELPHVVLTGVR